MKLRAFALLVVLAALGSAGVAIVAGCELAVDLDRGEVDAGDEACGICSDASDEGAAASEGDAADASGDGSAAVDAVDAVDAADAADHMMGTGSGDDAPTG